MKLNMYRDECLPSMYDTKLRRIDYCRNINLENTYIVKVYLMLLRSYRSYRGFEYIPSYRSNPKPTWKKEYIF